MAKLTEKAVRALQVPAGKDDAQLFDPDLPGFGVRKFASGKVSYFVKYAIGKKQRRKTLGPFVPGTLETVRKEAKKFLVQASLGVDAVAEAKKAEAEKLKTLGELVPVYIELREKGDEYWSKLRPKSLEEVSRYLAKSWLPLHAKPLNEITRQQIKDRRDEIVSESGAVSGNRACAALSTLFAWAIDRQKLAGANPTADIRPLKETKRDRSLTEDELVDVWTCAGDDEHGYVLKLLILTGQRRGEIGGLEWTEIDFEKRQIELPKERTKNKRPHIVPLSEPALALLRGIPRDGRYVFGGNGFISWEYGNARLDKRIAIARLAAGKNPMRPWVLHDLRRSVVTQLAESRIREREGGKLETYRFALPHVVEMLVNHVSGHKSSVAGNYNKAEYIDERRDALEQWGAHIVRKVNTVLSEHQSNTREKSDGVLQRLR